MEKKSYKMKKNKAGTSAPAGTATKSILKRTDKIELPQGESRKSKKRNKSVGFVLEEGETAPKKNKAEDSLLAKKHESKVYRNTRLKKNKKNRVFKDNPVDDEMESSPGTSAAAVAPNKLKRKATKVRQVTETVTSKTVESKPETGDDSNNNVPEKSQKRKCPKKTKTDAEEPEEKIRREPSPEDELTEELENMHIGSNRPNLALLLDNMVPVMRKPKKPKPEKPAAPAPNPDVTVNTDANGNEFNLKKVVKWTKRRWNKDRKDATSESSLSSQVVIYNLPVVMSLENRKNLVEVFEKHGTIKRIGETEVHPTNTGVEMYSTTIYYEKEESAIKALREDNTSFEDAIIRVRRPMPPAETTAVARSYTDLSVYMEELQEVFGSAGPLRGIRAASRRGSGMGLAFIEYYEPEAVERALALSGNIRISGKKVYVNRYDKRKRPSEPAEIS